MSASDIAEYVSLFLTAWGTGYLSGWGIYATLRFIRQAVDG